MLFKPHPCYRPPPRGVLDTCWLGSPNWNWFSTASFALFSAGNLRCLFCYYYILGFCSLIRHEINSVFLLISFLAYEVTKCSTKCWKLRVFCIGISYSFVHVFHSTAPTIPCHIYLPWTPERNLLKLRFENLLIYSTLKMKFVLQQTLLISRSIFVIAFFYIFPTSACTNRKSSAYCNF